MKLFEILHINLYLFISSSDIILVLADYASTNIGI